MVYADNLIIVSKEIETLVATLDIDYIDACLLYCEQHDIEIEQLALLLQRNQNIKSKIQIDAEKLNFIKKTQRLPVCS